MVAGTFASIKSTGTLAFADMSIGEVGKFTGGASNDVVPPDTHFSSMTIDAVIWSDDMLLPANIRSMIKSERPWLLASFGDPVSRAASVEGTRARHERAVLAELERIDRALSEGTTGFAETYRARPRVAARWMTRALAAAASW